MITFNQARRWHAMLDRVPVDVGEDLWRGVTGKERPTSVLAMAVADTTPREYAVLVGLDDIAAAFAVDCLYEATLSARPPTTPREAREIAHDGWRRFRALADEGGYKQHGQGADLAGAWPRIQLIREQQVDPKRIRSISDLAGRALVALRAARSKNAVLVPEQIVGVETGGDISALLASEYALLALDPTRMEQLRRLYDRELQQFERRGKERKAKGPLVIDIDESGSMMDSPSAPGRNTWAKAAATALTWLAWENKRHVVWVRFSTGARPVDLPPGAHAALAKAQNGFLDGGTDIGRALRVATEHITSLEKRGIKGADAVVISDGGDAGASIGPAIEELTRIGARLWSVAIACEFHGPLRDRAAGYVHLTDKDMHDPKSAVALAAVA